MSMSSGTKMKRGTSSRAAEHDRGNPFCAVHPELSSHAHSAVQSEPDVTEISYRRTEQQGLRAHVRVNHVMVTKKK